MNELRCYTFTLFQLSSIQQGIQAGHAVVELFNKYQDGKGDLEKLTKVCNWAKDHKTLLCLNGGDVATLKQTISFFTEKHNQYPWATFTESEDFLAGLVTSVAIVLPEEIYKTAEWWRKTPGHRRENGFMSDPVINRHYFGYHLGHVGWHLDLDAEAINLSEWEFQLVKLLAATQLAR